VLTGSRIHTDGESYQVEAPLGQTVTLPWSLQGQKAEFAFSVETEELPVLAPAQEMSIGVHPAKHQDVQALANLLAPCAAGGQRIVIDATTNSLILSGPKDWIKQMKQLIERLDVPAARGGL
jgi:type II secretory pathway component GspD/PulD (secretin)